MFGVDSSLRMFHLTVITAVWPHLVPAEPCEHVRHSARELGTRQSVSQLEL